MAFLLVKEYDAAERRGLVLSAAEAAWQLCAWRAKSRRPDPRRRSG